MDLFENIFKDALPEHLKAKTPDVWLDGWWRVGDKSKMTFTDFAYEYRTLHAGGEALFHWDARKENMRATGVGKELLFGQFVLGYLANPDFELREAVFTIYNEYAANVAAQVDRNAFYPVAVCPNWWDPAKAKETIGRIKALGLKAFQVPNDPGVYPSGRPIKYSDPELEPFWAAAEEAGLPICFHIIEKSDIDGPGAVGTFMLWAMAPFRKPWAQMMFGGVFDRHPGLQIVFAEGGINFVPSMLHDAEFLYDSFATHLHPKPKHRPTDYWFKNCYASFSMDKLGLELLKYIGEDNVMWASDYPHTEGTYGYSRHSQQLILDAVGPKAAKKILSDNAIRVFRLEDE
jgi:predicted TIM-barrel fold metal-dependent hydrolase